MKIQLAQFYKDLMFLGLGMLSWLGFSHLFILYVKILQGGSLSNFPWHYDAPLWGFRHCLIGASILIIAKWLFGLFSEKSKSIVRDFFIMAGLIPINAILIESFFIFALNLSYTGRANPDLYDWVMGFLHNFIVQLFVGFTCIGYFYLMLVNQTKEKLVEAQKAKTEIELKAVQQNLEPHFLFNNLNVLSELIETNPVRANEFLSKFSEIYRYILQTQKVEFVSLKDELKFAENYVFLLQERFGKAYKFDWQISENQLNGQMIIPVTLQTLIENAVKHNIGNSENPLQISIKLEKDFLLAQNEIREKQLTFPTNKSGLLNLETRYKFFSEKPIEVFNDGKTFRVKLPLLHIK